MHQCGESAKVTDSIKHQDYTPVFVKDPKPLKGHSRQAKKKHIVYMGGSNV
jgi:hypothetical protein